MAGYQIGEVCRILGVKPHILRYWEKEIPLIAPRKDVSGRRVYSESDVNVLMRVRHLLYRKKYTLEGVRRRLWAEMEHADEKQIDAKARIGAIRNDLLDVIMRISDSAHATESGLAGNSRIRPPAEAEDR